MDDDDDLSDLDEDREYNNSNKTPTHRDSMFGFNKKANRRLSKRVDSTIQHEEAVNSMSIIELMHQIVREPAPRLGEQFGEEAEEFVDACLAKDPDERHSPKTLLVSGVKRVIITGF